MRRQVLAALASALALTPGLVAGQDWTQREFPLAPPNATGNFVAPYFDGFYQNADGTYTLSFGFMNRNDEAVIEIPLGVNNRIEPEQFDGVQPTTFPVVRATPASGGLANVARSGWWCPRTSTVMSGGCSEPTGTKRAFRADSSLPARSSPVRTN